MSKLEVGMKFSNLRSVFKFLDIEDEYFGRPESKCLKLSEFCNWHRINKHSIIIDEVFEERKSLYKGNKNYSLEDLKNNFISLYNQFGRVLTYDEFIKNTSISLTTYCYKLNLSNNIYDTLIEMYLSKEIKDEYRASMIEYRKNIGKKNGVINFTKYTDEDLEINFKNVFDYYYKNYNFYPTRNIFNSVSKIDESVYRNRLKKKWCELCEYYGYEIKFRFKSENIALEICRNLLNSDYIPQKTFDWLKNDKNHHLFCDGYFENLNLVIEFDGVTHRASVDFYGGKDTLKRQKYNDYTKDKLLKEHGINVIRIDSRLDWHTKDGMIKILKNEFLKNNIPCDLLKVS